MPPWWGKSSSKEVKKKSSKESFIDSFHWKFKIKSATKGNSRLVGSSRPSEIVSEKGSHSHAGSESPSSSTLGSRFKSFAERHHALPLPLPQVALTDETRADSGDNASERSITGRESNLFLLPLPKPWHLRNAHAEGNFATDSGSSDISTDSEDPSDSQLLSLPASDYENGNTTAINSPSCAKLKNQSPTATPKK